MAETYQSLLGIDTLGVTAINLLSNSLAPSTYANYDSALRQFFAFCTKENIAPLQATPASMIRYTAWLGLLGTVAARSLQSYYLSVNKFFRDHHRPPIAVGELLADARRGIEVIRHRLVPADTRLPLPAPVAFDILLALTLSARASHGRPLPCYCSSARCASTTHFPVALKPAPAA
jgi:hypothetical protein